MKVTRWPAILIFTLLIVASLIIQPDNEIPSNSELQKNQPSLVGDIKNLSSTWYCVAGSVGGAGGKLNLVRPGSSGALSIKK